MGVQLERPDQQPPRVPVRAADGADADAAQAPRPPGALRPSRGAVNSRLPFWLVMLGLALVLGAFSRGEDDGGGARRSGDGLAFDLGSLPATGSGGYTASRPSNQALAQLRTADGRAYWPYAPTGSAAADGADAVAGVLLGEPAAASGGSGALPRAAVAAGAVAVHEFSLESGSLRVSHQPGPFDPARFTGSGVPGRAGAAPRAVAGGFAPTPATSGRFEGRLSDDAGSAAAALTLDADGALLLKADDGCSVRARAAPALPASPVRDVEAVFGSACHRGGELLRGHVFALAGPGGETTLFVVLADANLAGGAVFAGQRR